jgi:hypothetical protein
VAQYEVGKMTDSYVVVYIACGKSASIAAVSFLFTSPMFPKMVACTSYLEQRSTTHMSLLCNQTCRLLTYDNVLTLFRRDQRPR